AAAVRPGCESHPAGARRTGAGSARRSGRGAQGRAAAVDEWCRRAGRTAGGRGRGGRQLGRGALRADTRRACVVTTKGGSADRGATGSQQRPFSERPITCATTKGLAALQLFSRFRYSAI